MRHPLSSFMLILVLVCALSAAASAQINTCFANNYNRTFADIVNGISFPQFENGPFDCLSVTITGRLISTEFTLEAYELNPIDPVNLPDYLSDRLVVSNRGAGGWLNICFLSTEDSTNIADTCDAVGSITQTFGTGDPILEDLITPRIFDVSTGFMWYAELISQDGPNNLSDTYFIGIPEPSTILLLASGLIGVGLVRRFRR